MTSPELIAGKYRLDEQIGSGAWGEVYRGENVAIKKVIAIKILHRHLVKHEDKVARFFREARAAAALKHPGICSVYDVGSTDAGLPYYVMDFISGQTLACEIDTAKKLSVARAVDLCNQVCSAMAVAHHTGIIHRDLTANNIMIKSDGDPILLDFGLAKFTIEPIDARSITESGTVLGSPAYMSPEQCLGHRLDQRSDIYSLGCVLYEMLCGHTPFHSPTNLATMHGHVSEPVPPLDAALAIPGHVNDALMRSLSKRPDDRQQSMLEFAEELTNPVRKRRFLAKGISKRAKIAAAVVAGLLGLSAVGWTAFVHHQEELKAAERKKAMEMPKTANTIEQQADQEYTQMRVGFERQQYLQVRRALDKLVNLCADSRMPADKAARMLSAVAAKYQIYSDNDRALIASQVCITRLKQFCKPSAPRLIEQQLSVCNMLMQQASYIERYETDYGLPWQLYQAEQTMDTLTRQMQGQPGLERQQVMLMCQMANGYNLRKRYKKCIELAEKVEPYLHKASDMDFELANVYNCLGQAYAFTGNLDVALKMFEKDMQRRKSVGDVQGWVPGQVYASIGKTLFAVGDYKNGVKYLKLALDQYKDSREYMPLRRNIEEYLAIAGLKFGDPTEGYKLLKEQLRNSDKAAPDGIHLTLSQFESPDWVSQLKHVYVAPLSMDTSKLRSISGLSKVENLCLSGTHATDSQLAALGRMENIKGLFLEATDITDKVADCLKQFPNVEILDISSNNVGARTAVAVAQLKHLKRLDISNTQLKDPDMLSLSRSTCMKHVVLSDLGIFQQGIENISNSRSLQTVDLRGACTVKDSALSSLAKIPSLTRLELFRTCASGRTIGELKNLRYFYHCSQQAECDVRGLENLRHLKVLVLSDMPITDDMAAGIANMPDLEELNLACTDVTDKTLALLPKLRHLTKLNLNHVNMTDAGLESLGKCANLEQLHISQNQIHSLSPLSGLRKLQVLWTTDNPISDGDMAIVAALPAIQGVFIDRTPVTAEGLKKLIGVETLVGLSALEITIPAEEVVDLMHTPRGQRRSVRLSPKIITGNRALIPSLATQGGN